MRPRGVSGLREHVAVPVSERIPVEPAVIAWARDSAGFSQEEAARRIGVSAGTLARWEADDLEPTIVQLRAAARVYRRPLAVLLLSTPPRDFHPLADFRRFAQGTAPAWSPELRAEYRRAAAQREVLLEIAGPMAREDDRAEELTLPRNLHPEEAGGILRDLLQLDGIAPGTWGRPNDALRAAIAAVESFDLTVVQTQGVDPSEARGFSIAEHPFPFIALNGSDWPRSRLFTLFHELAHIAVRSGGLCDLHEADSVALSAGDELESYCNAVAAAILMPADRLLEHWNVEHQEDATWPLEALEPLSRAFGASSEAVILRLVTLGHASWDVYWLRKSELEVEYAEARDRERERRRESPGGPSYYRVKARDLGHSYVHEVFDAFRARAISSLDAADYLDVRFDQLPQLWAEVAR